MMEEFSKPLFPFLPWQKGEAGAVVFVQVGTRMEFDTELG
jgi:hypothetical protein